MEAWEAHFREKSRRRFRYPRVRIAKVTIMTLLLAELAVAAVLFAR